MRADAPLRILHVVEAFGGGVLEVVTSLTDRLAAAGDEVAIAYGRRPETPEAVRDHVPSAVELHALSWSGRGPREQLTAARELRALIRRWGPDVVHLHSSFAGVIGSLVTPRAIPTVYTPHGYSFTMLDQGRARRFAYRSIERLVGRRVTAIGAVSDAEGRAAREIVGAARVIIVPNGIPELDDLPTVEPDLSPAHPPTVITLGRLDAQRRPAESARILAAVSDIASVEWVGGGGRGGVPPSVVTDMGVPVTGWLKREHALEKLQMATACLHWAAWDGQPLAILEAMAHDVVVVASDIDAAREILGGDQVCATVEDAIQTLRKVLTDPAARRDAIQAQRQRRLRYAANRMASEWRSTYEALTILR